MNNPQKYNFEPKELLANIINMYANMGREEIFRKNIVNDSRSFKSEIFTKGLKIINNQKKGVVVDQSQIKKFEILVKNLLILSCDLENEEMYYENIPEEFLDPVLQTLMKDPVELPSSKTIVDFITISKHYIFIY